MAHLRCYSVPSGESLTIVRYHLISSHRISSHLTDDLLTEKLGLAGLRSNFVLILIGRYLKLLRGNYLAEYIAPIIEPVANGSIVLEFNLAHVNNRSQVHLQEIAHVQEICQKLIDTMLKTAFDLPLYVQTSPSHPLSSCLEAYFSRSRSRSINREIREICQGIHAIIQERNEMHMFSKIMAEVIFRHFVCDYITNYKSQAPLTFSGSIKSSKKDKRLMSPSLPPNGLPRISEALLAIGSMHTISPSSPLSLLNEFVFLLKPTVATLYNQLVVRDDRSPWW